MSEEEKRGGNESGAITPELRTAAFDDTIPGDLASGVDDTVAAESSDAQAIDDPAVAPTLADSDRGQPTAEEMETTMAPLGAEGSEVDAASAGRVTLPLSAAEDAAKTGLRFGRFVATGKLGVGGMGTVYAAVDPDLERKVAIKVMHYSKATEKAQTRFLREAQAMAQLSHPNVITVHEVGTRRNQVYVVMEHVDGGTLRRWVKKRSWQQILEDYTAAGEGLIAAHDLGLVHRDFKPDNVLVRKDGRVLVTDFGLVTLADEGAAGETSLAEQTVQEPPSSAGPPSVDQSSSGPKSSSKLAVALTRTGELMGTPIYMAPEQHAGKRVDARADQYAFCASLYEALYGVRPFEGKTYYELVDRLTKGLRHRPPAETKVPRWIEQVLVRGLEVDPEARYADMRELLEALKGEPPRSRRRWVVAAGVLALVSVGGLGAALFSKSPVDCSQPNERIQAAWNESVRTDLQNRLRTRGVAVEKVLRPIEDYVRAWREERRRACEATHVTGEQSVEMLDLRMICLDDALGRLQAVVSLAPAVSSENAPLFSSKIRDLPRPSRCARRVALLGGAAPPIAKREALREAQKTIALAEVLLKQGSIAEARKQIAVALTQARSLDYAPLTFDAMYWSAQIASAQGDRKMALAMLRKSAALATRAKRHDFEASALLSLMHLQGHEMKQYEAALALLPTVEAAVSRAGSGPYWRGRLAGTVGLVLLTKGDYAAAWPRLRESWRQLKEHFGEDHREALVALSNLALAQRKLGRADEAFGLLEKLLVRREKTLGAEHPDVATTLNEMGNCLQDLGKLEGAEKALRRALTLRRRLFGPSHGRTLEVSNNLAIVLGERGKIAQAEAMAKEAVQAATKLYGKDSPELAGPLNTLGEQLRAQGKKRAAWAAYAQGLANIEHKWGKKHIAAAPLLENLARIAITINQAQMAFDFMDRAIALRGRVKGAPLPTVINAYALRGSFHLAAKRYKEALEDFKRQRKGAIERHGHGHSEVARADYHMALAQERGGVLNEASASYQRAITMLERTDPKSALIVNAYRGLGDIASSRGALDSAVQRYEEAVKKAARYRHPQQADVLHVMAAVLVKQKKWAQAAKALEEAMKVREAAKQTLLVALAQFELGKVLWIGRLDRKRAVTLIRAARKTFVAGGDESKGNVEEIDAWTNKRR